MVSSDARTPEEYLDLGEIIARADLPGLLAHYEAARGSSRKTRAGGSREARNRTAPLIG